MSKHNPKNERIKHRYLAYLEEAKRMSPKSADKAAAAIALFERSTNHRDFAAFHVEQARRFKRQLAEALNHKTKRPLSKSTIRARLLDVKAFFEWLAAQPGYKSRISYADCDYFNPSAQDSRIATARRERPIPDIAQIRCALKTMPAGTAIERRDQALIAFALLSGARDDAIASLNLGHVNLLSRTVFQDARAVRTKFRKTFTSTFFPVGDDVESIVRAWVRYLRDEARFSDDEPLFPSTLVAPNEAGLFAPAGLSRTHWRNAGPIRRIFQQAFAAAGLPYFPPHSFRHTLVRLGQQLCATPEEFKAWSQNLAHEAVLTTLTSYGAVAAHRQAELLAQMGARAGGAKAAAGAPDEATIARVLEHLASQVKSG